MNVDGSNGPASTVAFSKRLNCFVANCDIPAGKIISFLTGEIVTTKEMLMRVRHKESNVDDPHQISSNLYILLDEASRHFRHSCDPNGGVCGTNTLTAIEDISKGDPICFDYSTVVGISVFDNIWRMDCTCGTPTCRGRIQSVLSLPRLKLKNYAIANALPDFVMEQITTHVGSRFFAE